MQVFLSSSEHSQLELNLQAKSGGEEQLMVEGPRLSLELTTGQY